MAVELLYNIRIGRKEKTHNIVYKTTNTVNGKYYYGVHSTNCLNDGYMDIWKDWKYAK